MSDNDVRIVKFIRPKAAPVYAVYYLEFGSWVRTPKSYTVLKRAVGKAKETKQILNSISAVETFMVDESGKLVPVETRKA